MQNFRRKALAVFLAVLTVLFSFPLSVLALDAYPASDALSGAANSLEQTTGIQTEPYELTDRREECVKHFRQSDGSILAVDYGIPVHTRDDAGNWQDVDNTLAERGELYTTPDAKIKFSKKITGNGNLFTLHDGNRKITLSLNGAKKKTAATVIASEAEAESDALLKLISLPKLTSRIVYANILENVDLEYIVGAGRIKENLIVKAPEDTYTYSFTLHLNHLEAVQNADSEIVIRDVQTKETLYCIPAGYMYDAAGVYTNAVSYTLEEKGNGTYTFTVQPDRSWMEADERVFPVTIDPPLYLESGQGILNLNPAAPNATQTTPSTDWFYVNNTQYIYWKTSVLPTLPASAYITDATFSLYTAAGIQNMEVNGYLGVYGVTTAWDETLTWNQIHAAQNPKGKPAATFTDAQEVIFSFSNSHWNREDERYDFSITSLVKKWYEGENYGLMIQPVPGSGFTGTATFFSQSSGEVMPKKWMTIRYYEQKGLEDYWSSVSQNAGFAGIGSVLHQSGNLVFTIPTLTTTDALMPITPTLVYQTNLAGKPYTSQNAQVPFSTSGMPYGWKWNLTETLVKKSYTTPQYTTVWYYVFTDADGTEHMFWPTDTAGVYEDEDGLLFQLKESGSNRTITDANFTVRTFVPIQQGSTILGWYLQKITDKNGNAVLLTVDSAQRPTSVTLMPYGLSPISQLFLLYHSSGAPSAVYHPTSGEGMIFCYSNTPTGEISTSANRYLRKVVRAHGSTSESQWNSFYASYAGNTTNSTSIVADAVATYTYDASGYLTGVQNGLSSYRLTYTYDAVHRVCTVQEFAATTEGQQFTLTYGTESTVIRTAGSDDVYGNDDDLLTTYQFDRRGRTVNCYTTNLAGTQLYGASSGQYVNDDNHKTENRLKSSVQTTQTSSNYLLNGGFEASDTSLLYWDVQGPVSVSTDNYYAGVHGAQIQMNSVTSTASLRQNVKLSKGEYNLSVYVRTQNLPEGIRAYLWASSLDDPDRFYVTEIETNSTSVVGEYVFCALPFSAEPPEGASAENFQISLVVHGTLQPTLIDLDNFMLSKTTGAAEFDLVNAGHFEPIPGKNPLQFFSTSDSATLPLTTVDSGNPLFGQVLQMRQDFRESAYIYQEIYNAGTNTLWGSNPIAFTVSGFAKGSAQSESKDAHFAIRVKVHYMEDGIEDDVFDFDFCRELTDWQFISGGFATNQDKGIVQSITVYLLYDGHPGTAQFDNLSVVQESSTTRVNDYNEKGYLTTSHDGRASAWYWYDAQNRLVKVISSNKTITQYTYTSQGNVSTENHSRYTKMYFPQSDTFLNENVITEVSSTQYTYTYGLPTVVQTTAKTGFSQTTDPGTSRTQNTYDFATGSHFFGTLQQETTNGKTTKYFYNANNGRLLATLAPDGYGVSYQYDSVGNLIRALPAYTLSSGYNSDYSTARVNYTYEEATMRLSTISTIKTTYRFVYDVFGNTTDVKAGNYSLAHYTYHPGNGKLEMLTYGNGHKVKYFYDALDRTSEIWYNTGTNGAFEKAYSYQYDTAGSLYAVRDHRNGEVTFYRYDTDGKLMRAYTCDSDDLRTQNGLYLNYDEQSRLSYASYRMNIARAVGTTSENLLGHSVSYSYSYNPNTGTLSNALYRNSGAGLSGYFYNLPDGFGRVAQTKVNFSINGLGSTHFSQQDYTYEYFPDNGASYVTGRVHQMTDRVGKTAGTAQSTTYTFAYDGNGNITSVSAGGEVLLRYTYDQFGQLIREDDRAYGKTIRWSYDYAGNIRSKIEYPFTLGDVGSYTSYILYTYGNSNGWGDLLTSYNGKSITYDAVGNPLSYYNGARFTWKEGRKLASATYNGKSMTFAYNSDGLRTKKTVNGAEHTYTWVNGQLLAEAWSDILLQYFYDATGRVAGFHYISTTAPNGAWDTYYYHYDVMGNVESIYNNSFTKVAWYTYDAYGNYKADGAPVILAFNHFTYRGYYYDEDLGLYYLQTRYYDPTTARFINADSCLHSDILGYNLFTYGYNNPVKYIDPYGESGFASALAGWSSSAWWLTLADGPLPIGDLIYAAGCLVLGGCVIAEAIMIADEISDALQDDTDTTPEPEAPSFPDESELDVDIDHIMKRHHPSSGKYPKKSKFPKEATIPMIEEFARKAYQDAVNNYPNSLLLIQEERYHLVGYVAGQKILIWVDIVKKIITTAYPG